MSNEDNDKPKLKVVAENSQSQVDANWLQQDVDATLVQLTANIIRVVRGAGKPHEILHQCADVVNAAVAYRDAAGRLPSPATLASAILLEREPIDYNDSFWAARQIAYRRIVRGALQIAASKLLGQRLQIDRGEDDIDAAIRELEREREEIRKKRAAEERAARPTATKKKPAKKPKSRLKRSAN